MNRARAFQTAAIIGAVIGTAAMIAAVVGTAASASTSAPDPTQTITSFFAALQHEDRGGLEQLTTPDFRAFENGKVLDRETMLALIHQLHQSGKQFKWTVTDGRVASDGHIAVVDYVNQGAISDHGASQPTRWLEVASLRSTATGWKIDFLSSQRMAETTQPSA